MGIWNAKKVIQVQNTNLIPHTLLAWKTLFSRKCAQICKKSLWCSGQDSSFTCKRSRVQIPPLLLNLFSCNIFIHCNLFSHILCYRNYFHQEKIIRKLLKSICLKKGAKMGPLKLIYLEFGEFRGKSIDWKTSAKVLSIKIHWKIRGISRDIFM